MNLQDLYPLIAFAYGTFGIAFGVMLWRATNHNVDGTRNNIQEQVKQAVINIKAMIDTSFKSMSNAVDTKLSAIPPVDFAALDTRLDELAESVPTMDEIRETFCAQLRAFESAQIRQVQSELKTLGLPNVIDEAKQQMQAQLPQTAIQAQRFMNRKVSARFAEEHPFETACIDMGKVGIAQILEGMYAGGGIGAVGVAEVKGGFGVR